MLKLQLNIKPSIAKNIPHPLDFRGSDQEKKKIITFIEKNIYEIYCENEMLKSMCTNSLLRMMEEEELDSFKKLTKAKEEVILNNVIQTCFCVLFLSKVSALCVKFAKGFCVLFFEKVCALWVVFE